MQVKEKQLTLKHIETVLLSLGLTVESYRGWILSESERRYMRSDVIMSGNTLREAIRKHNRAHPDQLLPMFGQITKGLRKHCGIDNTNWEEIGPVLTGLRIIEHSEAIAASWDKRREDDALGAMLAASERRATSNRPKLFSKGMPLRREGDRKVGGYGSPESMQANLRWREVKRWDCRRKSYISTGKESVWELR